MIDIIKLYCLFSFSAATATVEGKMSKSLKKVLKKIVAKDIHQELAVADAKLGGVIKVSILAWTYLQDDDVKC